MWKQLLRYINLINNEIYFDLEKEEMKIIFYNRFKTMIC
jgi:hypothetical protein